MSIEREAQPTTNPIDTNMKRTFFRASASKAQEVITSMNEWFSELEALYALPKLTKAQIARRKVLDNAIYLYDGFMRDAGKLPTGEYITKANKRAA